MKKIKISPSILSANFAKLAEDIKSVEKAGADLLHIDVMDGMFTPNITIGPVVIKSIKKISKIPFDVHLMINNPDFFINEFIDAGADIITIHKEATIHSHRTITKIKQAGIKAGISICPATCENDLDYLLDEVDLVLIMSVNPGFGGQKFIESQLTKIANLRQKIDKRGLKTMISVDGGINDKTAKKVIAAGADILVCGSYIFNSQNYQQAIKSLKYQN